MGTTWGPKVSTEGGPGGADCSKVRVRIPLRCGDRSVARDGAQHVHRNASVGHPGQPGVAEVVPAEVLVAEPSDDLVPVRRVAEDRRRDPAAAWSDEQARIRIISQFFQPAANDIAYLRNQRNEPCALALRTLVAQPARRGCGLPSHGPGPVLDVEVSDSAARYLSDPGSCRGSEPAIARSWMWTTRPRRPRRRTPLDALVQSGAELPGRRAPVGGCGTAVVRDEDACPALSPDWTADELRGS